MKAKKKGKKRQRPLQDYLSIGYLFLIVCGMVKDIIYYNVLDVNIIKYSSVIDILLSPIAFIATNKVGLFFILILLPLIYWLNFNMLKIHEFWKKKGWYSKKKNIVKLDKLYSQPASGDGFLVILAIMIFSFFLGSSMGGGYKVLDMIKDKTQEADHRIVFNNNETVMVRLLGQNSQFLFYVQPKSDKVIIVPIQGNIRKIEKIKKLDK